MVEAAEDFLREMEKYETPEVFWSYKNSLKGFGEFVESDCMVEDIDSYDVACYLDYFFQYGKDLDFAILELHCIRDFMNWACEKAGIDKVFGIMTIKERNSTHPLFTLLNLLIKAKKLEGNFMFWAIFLFATKKSENAFTEDNLRQNKTYSFTALVDDDKENGSDLLEMDNFCYYGGPVAGMVTITNKSADAMNLTFEDIIGLFAGFMDAGGDVFEIDGLLRGGRSPHFVPSNLKAADGEPISDKSADAPAPDKDASPEAAKPATARAINEKILKTLANRGKSDKKKAPGDKASQKPSPPEGIQAADGAPKDPRDAGDKGGTGKPSDPAAGPKNGKDGKDPDGKD
jgi:hypothetical protein